MTSSFGTVLKEWRAVRRMSQLELGSLAEVSPRHISFLESGRSNPSRTMVLHLTEILEVPRQERNRFLGAAGFSPVFTKHDPDGAEMEPIRQAITWTLERHDPFPAIVLDRHWNVVSSNQSAALMFAFLGVNPEVNMIDLFLEDGGAKELVVNWSEVGYFLLTRLRTENAAVGGDEILERAIATLSDDPEIAPPAASPLPPALAVTLRLGDANISLLSTIAQFGSAEDIALADQRVELFFPADDATRALFMSAGIGD
ncbi:MAG: helix-turn-helix transcriptional regulator [Acidimicrobiia bacterium]|nr:helix-turn-helix transcriptional regulator [Acidimicrobiia bacterium]